jgi:integrase
MPKQNLTQLGLKSLIRKPGRHADGGGLYFRVIGQGKCYWVFRYRLNGCEREASLGPYPELGLEEARVKHADLRKQVKVDKSDPLATRQAAKAALIAVSAKPTFAEAADRYIKSHEAGWRNAKHRRQWRMTLTEYCRSIGSKPVDEITTDHVLGVLEPIWNEKPETGSKLRGRIEVVLDAARARGHIDADRANPARWRGHLDKLLSKPRKLSRGHHAALAYGDVPGFVARLRASSNMAALALEFLILNASRTLEVLGSRWSEIDLPNATWTVPPSRMKIGEAHTIPLSDRAIAIIAEARSRARKEPTPEGFVFPGARPRQPLSHMSMSIALRRMGASATVHGFRTSFRTWASDIAHAEFEVAEQCLSHRVGSAVSRAYNRTSMLERRRPLMQSWADHVTGKTADNVVPLRARSGQ